MKKQSIKNGDLKKIMELVSLIKPYEDRECNRLKKALKLDKGSYNREVLTLYLSTIVLFEKEIETSAFTVEELHTLPAMTNLVAFFDGYFTKEEMSRMAYLTTLYSCFEKENYLDFLIRTIEDPQYFYTKEYIQTELYEKNIDHFKKVFADDEETFYKLKYLLAGVCKSCVYETKNGTCYISFLEEWLTCLKEDGQNEHYLDDVITLIDSLAKEFTSYKTSNAHVHTIHHFLSSFNMYYKDIYTISLANDIAKSVKKRIKKEIQSLDQLTHYCSVHAFIKLLEDKQRVHYFNFNFIKNQSSDELKALAVQFKQEVEYIERCIQTFTKADWEALELKNKQKMTGNYEDDLIYTVQFT